MTAAQLIAEIDALSAEERNVVIQHIHELEGVAIPESFRRGMQEAQDGELFEMQDADFELPPK